MIPILIILAIVLLILTSYGGYNRQAWGRAGYGAPGLVFVLVLIVLLPFPSEAIH